MSELMTEEQWLEKYKATLKKSDLSDRLNESKEERIARISSDPKPKWRAEEPKPYATTGKHYIVAVDADEANASMPEADLLYATPHQVGGFLVSDRLEVPKGWIKKTREWYKYRDDQRHLSRALRSDERKRPQ